MLACSLAAISALYFIEHSKQTDRIMRYEISHHTYNGPRPGGGRGSFLSRSTQSPNDPFQIQPLTERQKLFKKTHLISNFTASNINTSRKTTATSITILKSDYNFNKNSSSTTTYQSIISDDLEKPDEYEHQTYMKNDIKGKKDDIDGAVRNTTDLHNVKDENNVEIVSGVISKPNDLNWTNEVIPDNDVDSNIIDIGQRNTQNGSKLLLFENLVSKNVCS